MNIIINSRFLSQPISGVQRYAIECCKKIKKKYPTTTFVCPSNIIHKDIASELEVSTIGKRNGQLWEQIDLPIYLAKLGNPPLVNLCNTGPLMYNNNYITIHDLAFKNHPEWNSKIFSWWYNFMVPKIARKAKHIFTVSNSIKEEICDTYIINSNLVSTTYNGLSATFLESIHLNTQNKDRTILCVGSFNKRKNHHLLIEAYLDSELQHDYQLVIVGDKHKVFSETGLDQNMLEKSGIVIKSKLTDEALIAEYAKAEIIVSVSSYEGFGIPILEGLAMGGKVVCTPIAAYQELFNDAVIFTEGFKVADIKDALIHATKSTAPEAAIVNNYINKYSYDAAADVILSKVLEGN